MSYNPYAAPQVEVLAPPPPPIGDYGEPRPWTIGEVLSLGWARIKADGGPLVVASFVAQGIAGLPGQIPGFLKIAGVIDEHEASYWIVFGVCTLVGLIAGYWFRGGLIKVWLDAARGRKVEVGDVFKGGRFFWRTLGAEMLWWLASVFAWALIIPGPYVSLGFAMCSTVIVDRDVGVMEGLRTSWRLMKGQRVGLFGFFCAAALLGIGGMLACCMGILVVIPWVSVASTMIYLRISGQDDAVTATYAP